MTEIAPLKDSTVTVSYEEFLKSQENKVEQTPDSTVSICIPSETVEDTVRSGSMVTLKPMKFPNRPALKQSLFSRRFTLSPPKRQENTLHFLETKAGGNGK